MNMKFALKVSDDFVPEEQLFTMIDKLSLTLHRNYLEGAIYIRWNEKVLMDEKEHDYIDQLLCYVLNDINQILEGSSFKTYFPDQPLELELKPEGELLFVRIGDRSVMVPLKEFFQAFYELCLRFFKLLLYIDPSASQRYTIYLQTLEQLPLSYPWITAVS